MQIGRSGRHIGQEAIQLHGGIGMTMEYKVGHHFKRMTMIDKLFGDADAHLATLAQLGGLFGKAASGVALCHCEKAKPVPDLIQKQSR